MAPQRALIFDGATVRQIRDDEVGTGKVAIRILSNGAVKAGASGDALVNFDGVLRTRSAADTLLLDSVNYDGNYRYDGQVTYGGTIWSPPATP